MALLISIFHPFSKESMEHYNLDIVSMDMDTGKADKPGMADNIRIQDLEPIMHQLQDLLRNLTLIQVQIHQIHRNQIQVFQYQIQVCLCQIQVFQRRSQGVHGDNDVSKQFPPLLFKIIKGYASLAYFAWASSRQV